MMRNKFTEEEREAFAPGTAIEWRDSERVIVSPIDWFERNIPAAELVWETRETWVPGTVTSPIDTVYPTGQDYVLVKIRAATKRLSEGHIILVHPDELRTPSAS